MISTLSQETSPKHAATALDHTRNPRTGCEHEARFDPYLEQLDELGYAIVPRFLDLETTARLRAHVDAIAGPVFQADEPAEKRFHDLRHPIPGQIMADMVTPQLLELAIRMLRATELRLTEQVLIRTDPSSGEPGPTGWHIDMALYPRHLAATPRQIYVQMVHALSTVESGGGAVTLVPGSHHQTYAASARLSVPHERFDVLDQDAFKAEVMRTAGVDTGKAIEVLANEGDLILFHPMCVHSASRNVSRRARHVMFMSFYDVTAVELHARLNQIHYRDILPDSLRQALPEHLRRLLDR